MNNRPITYHEFRKRFLEAVKKQGLQLHSHQVRGLSPQGRPLFTDIAYSIFNPSFPTVIHISGLHGIEGYLGSLIQSEFLEDVAFDKYKNINLVFIHALNPWGMAWYRRVNGQNIDLNRNFFPDNHDRPKNKDFDVFAPLFEKKLDQKKWKIWLSIFKAILKKGITKNAQAIACGQYHKSDSLFFGGHQNAFEVSEPLRFIKGLIKNSLPVYILDVHSGLGKFATENWILDAHHSEEEFEFWNAFELGKIWSAQKNKPEYQAYGNIQLHFKSFFTENKLFYICQEFGTYNALSILMTLTKENKQFLKLIFNKERSFEMISAFYPSAKSWRQICSDKGKKTLSAVIEKLSG
jgi:hypothetical protein